MFQIAMKDGAISPEKQRKTDHIIFNKDEISDGNTVELGKLSVQNIRFTDNQLAGQGADGKIGTALFEGKSFKIDYDNNQFVVYDTLPDVKGYQPVPVFMIMMRSISWQIMLLTGINNRKDILHCNQDIQEEYSTAMILQRKKSLIKTESDREKTLKNSAGQSIITKQAILPFFKLGDFVFKNISVGFFAGELKTQNVSYFGADMLRRFVWIFDAERKTAYIKPSRYYSEPYYKIN